MHLRRFASPAVVVALAGCSGPDAPDGATEAQDAATTAPLTIVVTESGYEAPARVRSGWRHVVFENRGTQIHEAMFVKLPPGMAANDYVAEVARGVLFPAGALDYSGAGLTSPGGRAELWVELDPGDYIVICWFRGHASSMPVHALTVEEPRSDDALPAAPDVVVKLVDFRIDLEGELRAGPQVLRVDTVGPSLHELDFYRLHDGATFAELMAWHKADQAGEAPGDAITGILDSHDRRVVWLRNDFAPGRYVFWCTMPMSSEPMVTNTEVSHADAGMVREVVIAP
jgi:hypothetical protein